MKKNSKNLIIFESIIIILSLVSFFCNQIISGYKMIIFLFFIIFIFKKDWKLEKKNKESLKEILLEIIVFLNTFFILYYLFGLLIGYTRSGNYYSWYGLINKIIPLILYILLREYLRLHVLTREKENSSFWIVSIIMFISLDLSNSLYYMVDRNVYGIGMSFILSLFPIITMNLTNSYLTKESGYIPVIFFGLIIGLYPYLLPIVPNANIFLTTMVNFILPILLWVRIKSFYERNASKKENDNKLNMIILIIPTIVIILIIYIFSGFFRYYAVAIASNSMEPEINRGDIVILDQKIKKIEDLRVGEVIAYKENNYLKIQRIIEKEEEDDNLVFYTKGDATEEVEILTMEKNQIIGTVHWKIRYLGLPTVWLNNL